MFSSLRARLVLSHFIVILLVLLLTVAIASVPIRRAQQARLVDRLSVSAEVVARQLDLARLLSPDLETDEDESLMDVARRLIEAEQRRSGNRLLVARADGTIVLDSDPSHTYQGRQLPEISATIQDMEAQRDTVPPALRRVQRIALTLDSYSDPVGDIDDRQAVVAGTSATSIRGRTNFYAVALAPRPAAPLIDDVIRPLAVAGAIALVVSVLLGLLLARTVSGPIRQLTENARNISPGDLDQRVQVEGGAEVATLVTAINGMLERLASSYRSQRDLLANIAHELRTPLTSIQGYAQALRDGIIPTERERTEALDAISEESARMNELVIQIMQLSRLESGQLPFEIQQIDLGAVLARLRRQFQPVAEGRGVQLVIDEPEDLALQADPELLLQALGNLTGNAIRHTQADGRVEVRAARVASATRLPGLRIVVSDTGEGIAAEQLERVFERFYRASDRSATAGGRNFGLGLAIVHEVVSRHGGEITIESARGQGTVVAIELPAEHAGQS